MQLPGSVAHEGNPARSKPRRRSRLIESHTIPRTGVPLDSRLLPAEEADEVAHPVRDARNDDAKARDKGR